MRNYWLLITLSCCAMLLGCKPSQGENSNTKMEINQTQEAKLKAKIDALIADDRRHPSTDHSRVRSVCTYCGAWKESSPTNIVVSLIEGAQRGSPEAKQISDAKKTEAPFFVRHLEQCGKKGGMIKAIYPDQPGW